MGKGVSQYAACGKCGGTAREKLQLADRMIAVCMSCQGDVAGLLNRWLGGGARDDRTASGVCPAGEAEFNPGSGDVPADTVIFI